MDWRKASEQLAGKLHPDAVKSRSQAGRAVPYIEGWHAIAEANRIFGFGEWHRETTDIRMVCERARKIGRPPNEKDGWTVTYTAKVRVTVGNVVREGTGAGHGIGTDLGECHESAIKEAETDAMKRALMTFGNPFGLALYDKDRANVGIDEPPFDRIAARDRIKAKLDDAGSVEELAHHWKSEAEDIARLKTEDPPKFAELNAAKDKAKERLTKEAA